MEPIEELTESLTSLLHSVAERSNELDTHGQKTLLDALRQLLTATEKLNQQVHTLTQPSMPKQPRRPALYLVK